jgi:hypothetical protein
MATGGAPYVDAAPPPLPPRPRGGEKNALPAHATLCLKQWWNDHYSWPYPTVRAPPSAPICCDTPFAKHLVCSWPAVLDKGIRPGWHRLCLRKKTVQRCVRRAPAGVLWAVVMRQVLIVAGRSDLQRTNVTLIHCKTSWSLARCSWLSLSSRCAGSDSLRVPLSAAWHSCQLGSV